MDLALRDRFIEKWENYFNGADLPICFFYSDARRWEDYLKPPRGRVCPVCQLAPVRRGTALAVNRNTVTCRGGQRYLGFAPEPSPDFDYFLSCGIPGQIEGERYLKTPELVRQMTAEDPTFEAPARFGVFKRWDTLDESDDPDVVIFFATPDVASGLFTLANFDNPDRNAVVAPFGAGCHTILQFPYLEGDSERPRSVLGMFDVSARPCVPAGTVSFATPTKKFLAMLDNMDQSFLVATSWQKVRRRIEGGSQS